MSENKTTDIVKITVAAHLHNPKQERPDLNKLSAAAMLGMDIGMEEGTLTPDDASYSVEEIRLANISIQTGPEVLNLIRDAELEERWPRRSITDPRKFQELAVQAMFDDIVRGFTLMPTDAVGSLHDHLHRFCHAHNIDMARWNELCDYAAKIRAASTE